MGGVLYKISNGHYAYDILDANPTDVYKIADISAGQFNFELV